MAEAQPDFGGVDFTQYSKWPVVNTPAGGVYYAIPGSAFVYDPFMSAQRGGRPVVYRNPKPKQEDAARERESQNIQLDAQRAQLEAARNQASPMGQITPVLGATAGTLLGAAGINYINSGNVAQAIPTANGVVTVTNGGAIAGPGAAAATGAAPVAVAPTTAPAAFAGAPAGAVPVLPETVVTAAPISESAPAAAAPGLLAQAPGTTLAGSSTLGAMLPGLGIAAGAYTGLQQFQGARAIAEGKDPSFIQRAALFPLIGGLDVVAGFLGFGKRETTKDAMRKRWGELAEQGIVGAAEQKQALDSLGEMSGMMLDDQGNKTKWNFETALDRVKKGGTEDFRGVYGNFKTFGNDWSTYTADQQNQIVGALANADLYESKKGDVLVKDADAARKIKDQVLAGTYSPTVSIEPLPTQPNQLGPSPAGATGTPMQRPETAEQRIGKALAARRNGRR
jgi:hypothetical protein